MERVATSGGVLFVNNSMCTNVDAAVRSIEAVGGPCVLICGGADKGSDFAPLGAAIAGSARHLVVMGSAADLIEKAMVGLHRELRAHGMRPRLILQIHDELLLEVPESEAEAARALVTEVMEGALRLDVRLVADAHLGKNWAEVH